MGERKGVNKWYPPDYDPSKGGLNKWQGTHALRERARKIHLGIIIIRFEMPYNIWCEGCGNHIGMGVRYNAEKKKVGMYYTTPVYQFRMKCHLCTNHFEIKTDPANLDYVIVSGARRQEKRFEASENGTVVPDDKSTINKLADDAMFKLEHGTGDVKKAADAKPALGKIVQIQERARDDYSANRMLRDRMRADRKSAKKREADDKAVLKKAGNLDIQLLPETDADAKMAAMLRLQPKIGPEERLKKQRGEMLDQPIFPGSPSTSTFSSTVKSKPSPMSIGVVRKGQKTLPATSTVTSPSSCVGKLGEGAGDAGDEKSRENSRSGLDDEKICGNSREGHGPGGEDKTRENVDVDCEDRLSPQKTAEDIEKKSGGISSLVSYNYGSESSSDGD